MFRRILLASAGAMALAGTAFAADLPSRAPPPVFLAPPPVFTWTGFYAGLNAGYTFGGSNSVTVQTVPGFADVATFGTVATLLGDAAAESANAVLPIDNSGFIGGGQIGYNYQFYNSWVVGLESDIQGVATNNGNATLVNVTTLTGIPDHSIGTTLSVSRRLEYLGTVRERLGFLVTPTLLVYATGGLAYGGVNSSTSINQVFNGLVPSSIATAWGTFGNSSTSRVGWTAGGGGEWLFAPNWSVKVEYLYYDLGSVSYGAGALVDGFTIAAPPDVAFFTNAAQSTTRFNGNVVRAGLNYHFNWGGAPIVAQY